MRRSDELLYSGQTSASTPREVQAEKKEQDRIKLKPAADVVLEALAEERTKVTDIRSLVTEIKLPPEELSIELKARQLYLSYLNSLEFKIQQTLKEKPKKGKSNG